MLMRSHVAERIRHHNPEARVIAILRNPIATLSGLLHWLEVEGDDDGGVNAIGDIRTDVRHNITSRSRFHRLEGHLKRLTGPLRSVARAVVTDRHRRRIRRSLLLPLRKWTHVPFTPPPMDPSTTFFLRVHYHVQIERLGEMLGRDLRHWLDPTSSAASRSGP